MIMGLGTTQYGWSLEVGRVACVAERDVAWCG